VQKSFVKQMEELAKTKLPQKGAKEGGKKK
jgi:hypothetical protein